jgi:GNAT superfamily N-acetyltransferase
MVGRVFQVSALPSGFAGLRDAALGEGWKMLRVLEEDWDSGALRFDGPAEALFCAREAGALAGMLGLSADPYADESQVARLRRLYVAPPCRGHGIGRELVEAAVAMARAHGVRLLRVRAPAPSWGFYEACGFLPAVVRSATHVRPL